MLSIYYMIYCIYYKTQLEVVFLRLNRQTVYKASEDPVFPRIYGKRALNLDLKISNCSEIRCKAFRR